MGKNSAKRKEAAALAKQAKRERRAQALQVLRECELSSKALRDEGFVRTLARTRKSRGGGDAGPSPGTGNVGRGRQKDVCEIDDMHSPSTSSSQSSTAR